MTDLDDVFATNLLAEVGRITTKGKKIAFCDGYVNYSEHSKRMQKVRLNASTLEE